MNRKICILLFLLSCLTGCLSSMAKESSTPISMVFALDSQYTYLKSLGVRYHNDVIHNINESSIRAFIRELNEKRPENYRFIVFRSESTPFGIGINPDTTIESQREYIEKEEKKYAPTNFEYYPLYQCIETTKLLNDTTILILTNLTMPTTGKIILNLKALIPYKVNVNTSPPGLIYERMNIDYSFTLELKEVNNGINAIYYNIMTLENALKRYYSPPKHPRDVKSINGVHKNFDWKINSVQLKQIKSIEINDESTLDSIYALFVL